MRLLNRLRRASWFAAAGSVALAGAASSDMAQAGGPVRPLVVVTTNILGDVVDNVAGETADVVVLMPPGADPHGFGVSAAEAAQMAAADLLIANGLGLEEGLLANVTAAAEGGVPLLTIGEHLDPIPFGTAAGADAGHLDPHIWTDPDRMIVAVELIAEALTPLVAAGDREQLARNTAAYVAELEALTAEIEASVAAIPAGRRNLVTNHDVFGYFAQRFGFEVVGTVLPSGTTLASPSAADLAELVHVIDTAGVPAIFADSSHPDRLAQVLADETDTHVVVLALYTESLGPPGSGAETYLDMMRTNVAIITEALRS